MNFLRFMNYGALRVASLPSKPFVNSSIKRFRKPSICDLCLCPPDHKPCFDVHNVIWERGKACHARIIRSFLCTHYWPREPSVMGLWMDLNCHYLDVLTEKYSNTGDRFLAFERMDRTNEKKLVGVLVANQTWPWMIKELEEWAHFTCSKPEKYRMFLIAHCLKSPNLFKKYNVPYIYDIEILGSTSEATGHGVATQLLREALTNARDLKHPLAQVISLGKYTNKICERCGMKREWSMDYSEFVDESGHSVFFPRRPHRTVSVYVKSFPLTERAIASQPCKPPF